MPEITKVTVLGASGTLGQVIVQALLAANFTVTIITRPASNKPPSSNDSNVKTETADYDDLDALTRVLRGQDALVEAFNPAAASHQSTIVRAALIAGVSHIITPEFSTDTFNPNVDEVCIYEPKLKAQRELEALVKGTSLSWTAIIIGAWYDFAIEKGQFWVDKKTHTITRFGSGNQKYHLSRLDLNSKAVVTVLKNPTKFHNRPAYFASHTVSTNHLIDLVQSIGGQEWKVVDVPLDGFAEKGKQLWDQDTANGVRDRLNTQAYPMLGTAALFDEDNRYSADFSEKLEPGWDEGDEVLRVSLEKLLK